MACIRSSFFIVRQVAMSQFCSSSGLSSNSGSDWPTSHATRARSQVSFPPANPRSRSLPGRGTGWSASGKPLHRKPKKALQVCGLVLSYDTAQDVQT
jgi:hypothetical protein